AVVGSRAATAGGRDHTRAFASSLACAGLSIVSGMAAGVDAIAHEGALAQHDGITVAVVGTGVDVAYPERHQGLRDRIAERGAVVSEYLPGTAPVAAHFPARNRIIAGLALGTLVVEAAMRSGALITARLAAEAGREVFALPGSLHNPLARGCHHLIRQGATLAQEPAQVIEGLGQLSGELATALRERLAAPTELPGKATTSAGPGPARSDPDYQRLWQALDHDPTPMDSLVQRTGLTAAALSSMLLIMELEGDVVTEHGRYTRNP
ncbi:DNA-processing protein DprA, partial [Xanthomonas citri]